MHDRTLLAFGEVLLRLSSPGNELLLQSPRLDLNVGGAEANVAVSLSVLGHRVRMISVLPDNALGHACAGELRRHGVDTSALRFAPGRMGLYFLTPGVGPRAGDVLYDRAGSSFAGADPAGFDWPRLLEGAAWLHVSGITAAISAPAAAAAQLAMQAARAAQLRVSFDCNFRARVWGRRAAEAPALLRDLAGRADLLFANEHDLDMMFGTSFAALPAAQRSAQGAALAFERSPVLRWLATTVRERRGGVQHLAGMLATREGSHVSAFHPLLDVVDRIGSGDAFAAGLIDRLVAGDTPQACVDFATAAAVLSHYLPGDFNLSGRADIEALVTGSLAEVRR